MSKVTWFVINAYYIVMKKIGIYILPVLWKGGIFLKPFFFFNDILKVIPYGCTYTKVEEREELHVHSHSKKIMFKYNNFFIVSKSDFGSTENTIFSFNSKCLKNDRCDHNAPKTTVNRTACPNITRFVVIDRKRGLYINFLYVYTTQIYI